MFKLKRGTSSPDLTGSNVGQAIHEAEKAASAAVSSAGARVAETAGRTSDQVAVLGARAGGTASALTEKMARRADDAEDNLKASRSRLARGLRGSRAGGLRRKPSVAAEAILRAQLVKTSRDLSRESTDLREAVDSLRAVVKANRKARARGRRRLIFGLVLGGALVYHADPEHGHERRAATARRLRSAVGSPQTGASRLAGSG